MKTSGLTIPPTIPLSLFLVLAGPLLLSSPASFVSMQLLSAFVSGAWAVDELLILLVFSVYRNRLAFLSFCNDP